MTSAKTNCIGKKLPVEVKLEQNASTITVTSFTVIGKEQVDEKEIFAQIQQLNGMAKDGYFVYVDNGMQYLIKYIQKLILYDSTRKNSAVQGFVGEGILHLRAAAYSIMK